MFSAQSCVPCAASGGQAVGGWLEFSRRSEDSDLSRFERTEEFRPLTFRQVSLLRWGRLCKSSVYGTGNRSGPPAAQVGREHNGGPLQGVERGAAFRTVRQRVGAVRQRGRGPGRTWAALQTGAVGRRIQRNTGARQGRFDLFLRAMTWSNSVSKSLGPGWSVRRPPSVGVGREFMFFYRGIHACGRLERTPAERFAGASGALRNDDRRLDA